MANCFEYFACKSGIRRAVRAVASGERLGWWPLKNDHNDIYIYRSVPRPHMFYSIVLFLMNVPCSQFLLSWELQFIHVIALILASQSKCYLNSSPFSSRKCSNYCSNENYIATFWIYSPHFGTVYSFSFFFCPFNSVSMFHFFCNFDFSPPLSFLVTINYQVCWCYPKAQLFPKYSWMLESLNFTDEGHVSWKYLHFSVPTHVGLDLAFYLWNLFIAFIPFFQEWYNHHK